MLTIHQIPSQYVSHAHTLCAYAAFLGALLVGLSLHYKKIVENEHFGYPTEWFPSVSSTIGDRYPERSVFQIFIAMTSGPRFALVFLNYLLTKRPGSSAAKWVAGVGVFRTLTCGGWTYVTSTDDHNWHDYFMVSYLVASIPWTLGCLALSPPNHLRTVWWRKWLAGGFFATLVPMLYFFLQHKIHRVPGGASQKHLPWQRRCNTDGDDQPTPSTPYSNGPSSSSTLALTLLPRWTSRASRS